MEFGFKSKTFLVDMFCSFVGGLLPTGEKSKGSVFIVGTRYTDQALHCRLLGIPIRRFFGGCWAYRPGALLSVGRYTGQALYCRLLGAPAGRFIAGWQVYRSGALLAVVRYIYRSGALLSVIGIRMLPHLV